MKKKNPKKTEAPDNSEKRAPISPPAPSPAPPPIIEEESEDISGDTFPIVGIGASAGGLEAFTEMLQALPPDTGMAFVFIQHLDPKHVSLLTDLLQRQTTMTVQEATNGLRVEPNRIYVIPRNTHMVLLDGVLTLTPRVTAPFPHMPIDPFLRSLASQLKSRSIGVILSGNASDGALGMMAIKSAGGITFAQTPESSKHDGMPRSAIAAGCVDFTLRRTISVKNWPGWEIIPTSFPPKTTNPRRLLPRRPCTAFWDSCGSPPAWISHSTSPAPSAAGSFAAWRCAAWRTWKPT